VSLDVTTREPPLRILLAGDPRLERRCDPVRAIDDAVRRAIDGMIATLARFRAEHGFGRAIAAPQVGLTERIIVVDLGAGPFAVVNPEITWRSEETFCVWDDCFSVPDRLARVRRHRSISIAFRDHHFRARRWERLPPDVAELLQHEIDHLDGVLMLDRADTIEPASRRAELIDAGRGARRLSLARIAEAAARIDPVFRGSPQYVCEPLAEALGCRLTLKIETANPIRSFKGRGADTFVRREIERGARGPIVCASAGNFGQAMAYVGRERGVPVTVCAARRASPMKLARVRALGAEVLLEGDDFDAAKSRARHVAAARGATFVEDGLEAAVSEGAGSIGVELLARGEPLDAVVLPLGNGALVNGVARWIKAASPMTRVIAAASRGAPAMAEAWREYPSGIALNARVDTIADGIAVRIPVPEAVADMHGVVDDVVLVDDDALVAAMRLLYRHAGIVSEPAGAAGVAAVLATGRALEGLSVATVITGSNIAAEELHAWGVTHENVTRNANPGGPR